MATPAKNRAKRKFSKVIGHIQASFNNTIVTISNQSGDALTQSSAGRCGFKGSRKGTPFAAQLASEEACRKAIDIYDAKQVSIRVSGAGAGRESAIRAMRTAGLEVISIQDVTPLPHNGCRPRKKRRV